MDIINILVSVFLLILGIRLWGVHNLVRHTQWALIKQSDEIPTVPHYFTEQCLFSELPRDVAIRTIEEACPKGVEVGLIQGTFFAKNFILVTGLDAFHQIYSNPSNHKLVISAI